VVSLLSRNRELRSRLRLESLRPLNPIIFLLESPVIIVTQANDEWGLRAIGGFGPFFNDGPTNLVPSQTLGGPLFRMAELIQFQVAAGELLFSLFDVERQGIQHEIPGIQALLVVGPSFSPLSEPLASG